MNGRTPLVLAQLAFGVVPNSDPKFNRPFENSADSEREKRVAADDTRWPPAWSGRRNYAP